VSKNKAVQSRGQPLKHERYPTWFVWCCPLWWQWCMRLKISCNGSMACWLHDHAVSMATGKTMCLFSSPWYTVLCGLVVCCLLLLEKGRSAAAADIFSIKWCESIVRKVEYHDQTLQLRQLHDNVHGLLYNCAAAACSDDGEKDNEVLMERKLNNLVTAIKPCAHVPSFTQRITVCSRRGCVWPAWLLSVTYNHSQLLLQDQQY